MASTPVAAQAPTPEANGLVAFDAASFAASAPDHAYDMVMRLPGFSLVKADTQVRGYAGARGNVLIDGVQPTSRREDIVNLLRRIPAASVDRIELIRGGASGVDMDGHAVLANVIRKRAATSDMALQAGMALATDGWAGPQAQFEYGRRQGDRALELVLSAEQALEVWNDRTGTGRIRGFSPDGGLVESLHTDNRRTSDRLGSSVSWRQPLYGGSFSLNAALRGERYGGTMERFERGPAALGNVADDAEDTTEFEAGTRYVRPIGERSRIELMASQRRGRTETRSFSSAGGQEYRFQEHGDSGESLLRLEFGHAYSTRLRLSAGLEGAFNFIESQARMSRDGEQIELPGSDVRVEERRSQAVLGAAWQPRQAWTVEAGMRLETSALRQRGDMSTERDFVYFKPRLTAYWKRDDENGFHAALSREVGQLKFRDFAASAALDKGVVSAGNAALEPDKTWRLAMGWERSFREDGALGLTWTHERIADVVDRVLVVSGNDGFDAPGNIGEGKRDTLQLELSDSLGGHGLRFSSKILWRTSSVVDPTTGEPRAISGDKPLQGRIDLMQTVSALRVSWGVGVELANRETRYSYDEVRRERDALSWNLHAEKWVGDGWRLRMEVHDLFGLRFSEERSRYDGPRSRASGAGREILAHRTPGQVLLTVRRSLDG